MSWYKNLKIRLKLLISFILVIVLASAALVYSLITLMGVDSTYSWLIDYRMKRLIYLEKTLDNVSAMRRDFFSIEAYLSDPVKLNGLKTEFESNIQKAQEGFKDYENSVLSDSLHFTDSERDERIRVIDGLISTVNDYHTRAFVPKFEQAAKDGHLSEEDSIMYADLGLSISTPLVNTVDSLVDDALKSTLNASDAASDQSLDAVYLGIIITVAVALVAILIAMYAASVIVKPITRLVGAAREIADGNINININADAKDETGDLSRAFGVVVQNLNTLIHEVGVMYKAHDDGDLNVMIDENAFKGSYKELAGGVNKMVKSYIDIVRDVLATMGSIVNGNMNARLKEQYRGEKSAANREVEALVNTTKSIITSIDGLASEAKNGNLAARADHSKYEGEWKNILIGLNGLVQNVSEPINNSVAVLETVSRGDFNVRMEGDFKGDFKRIKDAVNGTVTSISFYIGDISTILAGIAEGDLTKHITRDYIGDFSAIKDAINNILNSLNTTMQEITTASGQVLTGSRQISQSAMLLAQGATEQASAVEELTATVDEINNQTQDNSKNAQLASTLAATSKGNAENGNNEMQKLLKAMEGITRSSQKISNIIKTIEDIASQTNLLALNASVEAARAGEHGLGFTVVAGEVRSLASKSQEAAKETNALIQESIQSVNEGTKRAGETANSLSQIVGNAVDVSEVIGKIYEASVHQAEAIGNVGIGLNQISQVVQSNSATSQQSAAASQELNSQSETLQSMIAFFKVK